MKKEVTCPHCEGRGWNTIVEEDEETQTGGAYSLFCNYCHGTGVLYDEMTKADEIRQMDDESLADVLLGFFADGCEVPCHIDYTQKYEEILNWLSESVE